MSSGAAAAAAGGGGTESLVVESDGDESMQTRLELRCAGKEGEVAKYQDALQDWFAEREQWRLSKALEEALEARAAEGAKAVDRDEEYSDSSGSDEGEPKSVIAVGRAALAERAAAAATATDEGAPSPFLTWAWETGEEEDEGDFPNSWKPEANSRELLRLEGRPNLEDLRLQVRSLERRRVVFWMSPDSGMVLRYDTRQESIDKMSESPGQGMQGVMAGRLHNNRVILGAAANPLYNDPFVWSTAGDVTPAQHEKDCLTGSYGSLFVGRWSSNALSQSQLDGMRRSVDYFESEEWVERITINLVVRMITDPRDRAGHIERKTFIRENEPPNHEDVNVRALAILRLIHGGSFTKAAR